MTDARQAAERVARDSYGRLVAYLSARCRDLAAVEDALAQAFLEALQQWPARGVPQTPEAWLLTAARRRLADHRRNTSRFQPVPVDLDELATAMTPPAAFPDDRLKLLFVCAHPAIDAAARTPLMLQTVLGIDAATIAAAFVVPAATMSQRLVRAKQRIRDLNIPFAVPTDSDLADRLESVLHAVYAAYSTGWDATADTGGVNALAAEAIHLARVLVTLLPGEPEACGLLALLLHCEARRPARFLADGRYVPLLEQDAALWQPALLNDAEQHLRLAARSRRVGRFQLEAAIQSAHNRRAFDGVTPWEAIHDLYEELVRVTGSVGAVVAAAAARCQAGDAGAAEALLSQVAAQDRQCYQPWWVVKAEVSAALGCQEDARKALAAAIALTTNPATLAHLTAKLNARTTD